MPTTKIVCRLFDAQGVMLGWTQHEAAIRGDGMIRAADAIAVTIDQAGELSAVSWHWVDVNVETRVAVPLRRVVQGQTIIVAHRDDPLIHCGPMPGPLPAVTLRQSPVIGVPAGQLGAVAR